MLMWQSAGCGHFGTLPSHSDDELDKKQIPTLSSEI